LLPGCSAPEKDVSPFAIQCCVELPPDFAMVPGPERIVGLQDLTPKRKKKIFGEKWDILVGKSVFYFEDARNNQNWR